MVVFAFLPFTVKELKHRVVSRNMLDYGGHDLEQRFAQSGRPTFGNMSVLQFKGAKLARRSIYTGECH